MSKTVTITLRTDDDSGPGNANEFYHSGLSCDGNHTESEKCDGKNLTVKTTVDVTVTVKNCSNQRGGYYYKIGRGSRAWQCISGEGGEFSFTLGDARTMELAGDESATGVFTTLTLTKDGVLNDD